GTGCLSAEWLVNAGPAAPGVSAHAPRGLGGPAVWPVGGLPFHFLVFRPGHFGHGLGRRALCSGLGTSSPADRAGFFDLVVCPGATGHFCSRSDSSVRGCI